MKSGERGQSLSINNRLKKKKEEFEEKRSPGLKGVRAFRVLGGEGRRFKACLPWRGLHTGRSHGMQ